MKLVCGDLNARIQRRLPGEEPYIGEHTFGHKDAQLVPGSNRELLLELCVSNDLYVANTFFDLSPEQLIAFRNVGTYPGSIVTPGHYATLDLFLGRQSDRDRIVDVRSYIQELLASHRFAIVVTLAESLVSQASPGVRQRRKDHTILKSTTLAKSFADSFDTFLSMERSKRHLGSVDEESKLVGDAFSFAEDAVLPDAPPLRKRPWINDYTLSLSEKRRLAQTSGDAEEVIELHKAIKKSGRQDWRKWLDEFMDSGSWDAARRLRRGAKPNHNQGRLKDERGEVISSEDCAQTLAKYLQDVQWKVRPAKLFDDSPMFPELDVELGPITLDELRTAARLMKSGKASGPDGKPIEYWKTVLSSGTSLCTAFLLNFCNNIWSRKTVPNDWHLQSVALLFKKGDPADPGNYRPVCLLAVAYKLFTMVLLQGRLAAGADSRLWASQFAFRRGRGTEDALYCVRRAVELAWSQRGGKMYLLALDWRKAFGSINSE